MVLRKDELEVQLKDEHKLIQDGVLRDDSPLDDSEEFLKLCEACRRGDLKGAQEMILTGVNINARDKFDYTPLILASLCGHYELVQLLLEAGALCERDTFQGERCLYNALNNKIRNLLLQYDYSKSTDPLQPLASHITGLLTRRTPQTSDITVTAASDSFQLHKFILSARSPYFSKKLAQAPETTHWKLPSTLPAESFQIALRYLYLSDIPADLGLGPRSTVTVDEVFKGIDKMSKQLEIQSLWDSLLAGSDRRIARQRHQDEVNRGRDQLDIWYRQNVLKHKMTVDVNKADAVKWTQDNSIFADVLLRADEEVEDVFDEQGGDTLRERTLDTNGIPIGPSATSRSSSASRKPQKCMLIPAHRAMLIRSEYFHTMFCSEFHEAQMTDHLQIITVDCSPEVLEVVLEFLYTENAEFGLDLAIDVLYAADMLFIDKLKTKAAVIISTLGNGSDKTIKFETDEERRESEVEEDDEVINVYDVMRAGWFTRVQRLEEFAARYLANRLEQYIDEADFEDLVKESASRIQQRQETDTIELIDDIRYYLSERFRLRFEDSGLEEMMDENGELSVDAAQAIADSSNLEARKSEPDEAISLSAAHEGQPLSSTDFDPYSNGQIRTLDGEIAGDEFASDAINYQILLGKIDKLLDKLNLDG